MNFPAEFDDRRDEVHAEYRKFVSAIPSGDEEAYNRAFQPILEYCDSLVADQNADSQETTKGIVARMHAAKKQFTGLVRFPSFQFDLSIYFRESNQHT